MADVTVRSAPTGGFSFGNCRRNALVEKEFTQKGHMLPAARKTGTTIAGIVFKDGIILGADTRATEGMIVADKNCSKIHYISSNVYLRPSTSETRKCPVVQDQTHHAPFSCRYQGYIGAALVLGGVDCTGPHLYSIYPHGSTDKLPYVTMGSGSLAAMAVFEDRYKPDMEEEEAKQLVRDAIASGIFNDLGSGSNIDLCVITKNNLDYIRPHDVANKKGVRTGSYKYKKGTTGVLSEQITQFKLDAMEESVQTMDIS
ncbi:proteasome subunit beta type-7 [Ascaphus truei]|uniref:proteasome subunit beta type-7 n=1 Tax=Ascaphus truei TaxID=8439 RepID=UPI003F5AD8A6